MLIGLEAPITPLEVAVIIKPDPASEYLNELNSIEVVATDLLKVPIRPIDEIATRSLAINPVTITEKKSFVVAGYINITCGAIVTIKSDETICIIPINAIAAIIFIIIS